MKPLFPIALALLASLATPAANAKASASVVLSNLRFELIDLNPTDAVTPSFTLVSSGVSQLQLVASGDRPAMLQTLLGAAAFDPIEGTASSPYSFATASAWANGMAASGYATGTGGVDGASFSGVSQLWNAMYGAVLTVSANTLLRMRIDVAVSVSTTVGYDPSGGFELAVASSIFNVVGPGPLGVDRQESYDATYHEVGYWTPPTGAYGPEVAGLSRVMEISFSNLTGSDLSGNVQLAAAASGLSSVSAVPEPATLALMLTGLTAVGWRARRRA